MSHVFVSRLQDIDGDEMNGLADALRTSSGPAVVCSALELPPEQQDLIQKAIQEAFPVEVHVEFETDEALIGGIELTVSGRRIAWSVENQLAGMETRIANLLEQGAESSTAEDTLTEEPLESGIITPAAGESP